MKQASRARAFGYIAFAYAVALGVAWNVMRWLPASVSPLAAIAWADLAATITVFAFSVGANNTSVYDPYWSLAPIPIALSFAAQSDAPLARKVVVCALVIAWGLRLTYNWARGFTGLDHEDWRYADIREKTGRAYWPASFAALHLFPTVQVYLGCLPLSIALTSTKPLGPIDAVAAVVTLAALAIETIADEQLLAFRRRKKEPGAIMNEGLWACSRHPNYFGEIGFWWGLALFAIGLEPRAYWAFAGAVAITVMFVFASVPLLDKRSIARRPAYAEHVKRVSAIVPWPPKR